MKEKTKQNYNFTTVNKQVRIFLNMNKTDVQIIINEDFFVNNF